MYDGNGFEDYIFNIKNNIFFDVLLHQNRIVKFLIPIREVVLLIHQNSTCLKSADKFHFNYVQKKFITLNVVIQRYISVFEGSSIVFWAKKLC